MFAHLHQSAQQRFETLFDEHPSLLNEVPLQYIASMLRMTPETLSRLRSQAKNG